MSLWQSAQSFLKHLVWRHADWPGDERDITPEEVDRWFREFAERQDGEHLRAARTWVQHRFTNGNRVPWGSHERLGDVTPHMIDEVAQEVRREVVRDLYRHLKRVAEVTALPRKKE